MALFANNVQIPSSLSGTMSQIGAPMYNQINSNYANAKKGLANDASIRGMNGAAATGPGSYAGNRLAATQGLDVGNLESALGGGIGNTAYQDALAQREYGQNEGLARMIGSLNKPNQLEQAFRGIGSIGGLGAGIYGAWGRNARSSLGPNPTGELPPDMSYIPGGSATNYYRNPGAY